MAEPIEDPYSLEAANARFAAAGDVDNEMGFFEMVGAAKKAKFGDAWYTKLPENIGVAAYKAALNTLETGVDMAEFAAEEQPSLGPGKGLADLATAPLEWGAKEISEVAPGLLEPLHALEQEWTKNNTVGDDVFQGVAQFAIPFVAFMRLLGGLKSGQTMLNIGKAAVAESAAVGTAFDPHDGRVADLLQLGRESEGKWGALLQTLAPDGSLANAYVNMMTDRENEGEWEGRFKNIVDSLTGSAALAAALKSAVTGFRLARQMASPPVRSPRSLQRGSIGVENAPSGRVINYARDAERGDHIVNMYGIGEIAAQEGEAAGKPYVMIKRADVKEEFRGTGAGVEMYMRLANETLADGKELWSDAMVSEDALRVYDSLARRGYTVVRNGVTTVNPNTGSVLSTDPNVPVFKITAVPKQE